MSETPHYVADDHMVYDTSTGEEEPVCMAMGPAMAEIIAAALNARVQGTPTKPIVRNLIDAIHDIHGPNPAER